MRPSSESTAVPLADLVPCCVHRRPGPCGAGGAGSFCSAGSSGSMSTHYSLRSPPPRVPASAVRAPALAERHTSSVSDRHRSDICTYFRETIEKPTHTSATAPRRTATNTPPRGPAHTAYPRLPPLALALPPPLALGVSEQFRNEWHTCPRCGSRTACVQHRSVVFGGGRSIHVG